ncbi:MAG: hypothetical protein Q7J35_18825 [Candidatus Methanoperedens sp.]|nr:hypothetical protein [Candidatus Methanoperedens sp.]
MNKDKATLFNNTSWFFWLGVILLAFVSGCVSKPDEITGNETPAPISSIVSPAPVQLYIKAGQSEQFIYKSHTITVNYTSAYPLHIVRVTFDGTEKIIQKETSESPGGIYWKEKDISFTLKPVLWEIRDLEKIPIYEKTWNTTELYFEASGD